MLVDLKPSGRHYMEHFHWAGGVPRLLAELGDLLDLDAPTVTGETLRAMLDGAERVAGPGRDPAAHRPDQRERQHGGAARQPRAARRDHQAVGGDAALMTHTGRAVVFDSVEDMTLRVDDPDLDVTADDVLVLRNAGPKGAPGMPEAGYLPIPKKLAAQGVKDMVRISDARMSGTAFGTIVLHMAPEAAAGGPLGLVRNGDSIRLDVAGAPHRAAGRRRRARTPAPGAAAAATAGAAVPAERGYGALFHRSVLQADEGCDFDFLVPGRAPRADRAGRAAAVRPGRRRARRRGPR